MAEKTSHYIHGTTPAEQKRLSRLNELINQSSLRELRLKPGERVLDVGSGLGQLSQAIALALESGYVLGIERSQEQLAQALRIERSAERGAHLEFRQGDALDLPLRADEWGSFDLAHTRFLLEHVPQPLEVVKAMARAVRANGRVVLEDDDHQILRLWPEPVGFYGLWNAYMRSYELVGNDPFVGRRLVAFLHGAGLAPSRNTWLFFGSCSGEPSFPAYTENLIRILEGARAQILEARSITSPDFDGAMDALQRWGRRKDAALWYAICWAEGTKLANPPAPRAKR